MRYVTCSLSKSRQPRRGGLTCRVRRGGAVIILSLALLMSLLFLGLFFFSFVDDESRSADIYARQSLPTPTVSNRHVLNHGLSQVVVGTNDSDENEPFYAPYSVLFGGRYSMLAHLIGPIGEHDWDGTRILTGVPAAPSAAEDLDGDGYFDPWTPTDYEPFNGAGVRVIPDGAGGFDIDTDNDGANDVPGGLSGTPGLRLHAGPLADGASFSFDPSLVENRFDADAGYTYPDLNALFLYHRTVLQEDLNGDGVLDPGENLGTAIKPSFDAPGILYATGAGGFADDTHSIDETRSLRPHTAHGHGGGSRYITGGSATDPVTGRVIPPIEAQYVFDGTEIEDMGLWNAVGTGTGETDYELAADADGDGVNDAHLTDLDYPLIQFPDGRGAVPLFFWRIEDLDALVNVNTAGDMPLYRMAERANVSTPNYRQTLLASLVGDPRFLTGANYGQSPSEINPGIPLRSDTTEGTQFDLNARITAAEQLNAYYSQQAGLSNVLIPGSPTAADRLGIGNTELLWLLTGRHEYDASSELPEDYDITGRYGEPDLIVSSNPLFAAAGNTGIDSQNRIYDDDSDSNAGRRPNGGRNYNEWFPRKTGQPQVSGGVPVPPAVHPLDGTGFGVWLTGVAGTDPGLSRQFRQLSGIDPRTSPSQWLSYNAMAGTPFGSVPTWQHQRSTAAGVIPWVNATVATLQDSNPSAAYDAFWDEPDEMIVDDSDPSFTNTADEPFPASEMSSLHASNADWSRLNGISRLRKLAPINFEINFEAEEIRRQFTTTSWDRPEFGFSRDNTRTWEVADAVGSTASTQEFPPKFGPVAVTSAPLAAPPNYTATTVAAASDDPLRPELRRLLYVDYAGGRGNRHPQHRLQLNGILSDESLSGAGGESCFDKNGNPRFRPLVPHPLFDRATDTAFTPQAIVHVNGGAVPAGHAFANIGANKEVQEWWARYDRQRLARDVYTLLWMLGSAPSVNPLTTNPYTPVQIEELAQTAVNVVDAMDHDNVITKFVYDDDLTDGWDATAATTTVKYGMEVQALTFSEALWINATKVVDGGDADFDHPATYYDDGSGEHHFLYMELRNTQPTDVSLADDTYQITREEDVAGVLTEMSTLTIDGALSSALVVGGGENFLIGSHNDSGFTAPSGPNAGDVLPADFRLDYDANFNASTDIEYHAAAPAWDEADPPGGMGGDVAAARSDFPDPICDLDISSDRDRVAQPRFVETGSAFDFVQPLGGTSALTSFQLVLKRRLNTFGDGLIDDAENDLVEIDRITVYRKDFTITDMNSATDVQTAFRTLTSREREEPLYADTNGEGGRDTITSNGFYKHSLGAPDVDDATTDPTMQTLDNTRKHQRNSLLADAMGNPNDGVFRIWQPHFDRGFTSVMDVLSVQFIGPEELIYHDRTSGSVEGGLVQDGTTQMTGIHSAGMRFLNPQPTLPVHLSAHQGEHYANRWYRLLEFLSVPSHTSDEVADDMTFRRRVPGKINLNTVRHEHVLAAAINDRDQLDLTNSYFPADDEFSTSAPNNRNWYSELRRSRDGFDTTLNAIYPPGTPFANPFRPLTFSDPLTPLDPLASTILRNHVDPTAATDLDDIGLFEARNPSDVTADDIDWHTRQRILSRIANLTTNRSHVYVIWGGFQLHDAYEVDANDDIPQVRIGARLATEPIYRELIVVDLSRMEEAYDTATGAFNFEGFILHREVLP